MVSDKQIYAPSENIRDNVLYAKDPELIVSGPAGTGKSRAILEKFYLTMAKYPGTRCMIFRKIKATLNNTGLMTWERYVLPRSLKIRRHSRYDNYTLPNGSVLDVAGMDDPEKIKSGEWDLIFGQEITECDLSDWELAGSRLRGGVAHSRSIPYRMLIGDCNPSHPKHWVKVRCETLHHDPELRAIRHGGTLSRMVETYHQDNPVYYDRAKGTWTQDGYEYISRLRSLTGIRRLRLYKGIWASAEGMVYESFDDRHLAPKTWTCPDDWPRLWSFDFGFTAPFVWQEWVLAPTDYSSPLFSCPRGSLVLYREIYLTRTLVEDHAKMIKEAGFFYPVSVVADHDAEDRATLERHLRINTAPAYKDVTTGIQACMERMRTDIRTPTLYVRRGALIHEPDPYLVDSKKPTCTEDEFYGYVWNPEGRTTSTIKNASALRKIEYPLMVDDHGMDAMRYRVAQNDIVGISDGVFF